MKAPIISIKTIVWDKITRRGWGWISLLWVSSLVYYYEFFSGSLPFILASFITILIVSMLLVGYLQLGVKIKFPVWPFIFFVVFFSVIRFVYIYAFLSLHLPEYTLFHYPIRAIPAVIFGSASLLFMGYSYAIYEWGLAAREKYMAKSFTEVQNFEQPLILRNGGKTSYVLPQDIIYVSANGEYINYHTARKKYMCFQRLKEAEIALRELGFQRCHRSYIVNLNHLESVASTEVTLTENIILPLSKTYKAFFTGN